MKQSYIIIAYKQVKRPKGFRVHGEKAKLARLERLKAEGWQIREIRPYNKTWTNV